MIVYDNYIIKSKALQIPVTVFTSKLKANLHLKGEVSPSLPFIFWNFFLGGRVSR